MKSFIDVRNARVHNLKNISVKIPRDALTVVTGLSGSGKSSLAFDTIYAEGQRRYVESLSLYARQFLDQLSKPDVDSIEGLSPTISIQQKTIGNNPRSTVGTVTELWDFLRLLYARLSEPVCYQCGSPIQSQSEDQIFEEVLKLPEQSKLSILAPIIQQRKGEYQSELAQLRNKGFVRVRVDGEMRDLNEPIFLEKNRKHSIEVVVDRLILKPADAGFRSRLQESLALALKLGNQQLIIEIQNAKGNKEERLFSQSYSCKNCGISYPPPEPRTFSFNSPVGQCPTCEGLGYEEVEEFSLDDEDENEEIKWKKPEPCPSCKGARLKPLSLSYKLGGKNIAELADFPISDTVGFFKSVKFNTKQKLIADRVMRELEERLRFLNEVGVGYLSLSRPSQTLSGGESQRIKLATQLGSALTGVIYVLDEPSIGLHQRDNDKLIATLQRLRDQGNTVLVVEHDQDTMEVADHVVDIGPRAGIHGGELIFSGKYADLLKNKESLTARYLRNESEISLPTERRKAKDGKKIRIEGAHQNNLKNISFDIPLGTLVFVTGVSGSGKSTLVMDTLYPSVLKTLNPKLKIPLEIKSISGVEALDKVIDIDQSPIGRTPRSNPATYIGLFTFIRQLFSSLPEAQLRGFGPGRFSFNVPGGRCEDCEGGGEKKIEIHFLPDVYVQCETCLGKRYNEETLNIKFKGKSIADVLDLTVEEAVEFFDAIPHLKHRLSVLMDVGLSYLKLGQSATTLSGGEAQRIKLVKELSKRPTGRTLYIFDEPSTGLHFDDIKKLMHILNRLVDTGNTVVVIEHHLDMIKCADHLIDMGPEAGVEGGQILAAGTPEDIAATPSSITGRYLKKYLAKAKKKGRSTESVEHPL